MGLPFDLLTYWQEEGLKGSLAPGTGRRPHWIVAA